MTSVLGISAYYHDSAAALVVDGKIVAAAQEERFTRKKHDHNFPSKAIDYCLGEAGLAPEQLDSHAASAFFPSPFDEAAILTLDGVGEWATTSYGVGRGNHIELLGEMR